MNQRLDAAKQLRDLNLHCPVYVDKMENEANFLYGAMPERLYIILDSIVVYEGDTGPYKYKVAEVYDWLNKYFKS